MNATLRAAEIIELTGVRPEDVTWQDAYVFMASPGSVTPYHIDHEASIWTVKDPAILPDTGSNCITWVITIAPSARKSIGIGLMPMTCGPAPASFIPPVRRMASRMAATFDHAWHPLLHA